MRKRPAAKKLQTFDLFLRYPKKVASEREIIQRLMFKAKHFADASKRGKALAKMLAKVGNYKKIWVLGIAEVDTLKKYASMPSSLSYFGKDRPEFIKEALRQAKKNAKSKKKTKLKKVDPKTFMQLTVRG